jgi:hypothetical protein
VGKAVVGGVEKSDAGVGICEPLAAVCTKSVRDAAAGKPRTQRDALITNKATWGEARGVIVNECECDIESILPSGLHRPALIVLD